MLSRKDLLDLIEEWVETSQVASSREEVAHAAYYELVHYKKTPEYVLLTLREQTQPLFDAGQHPFAQARLAFIIEAEKRSSSEEEADQE